MNPEESLQGIVGNSEFNSDIDPISESFDPTTDNFIEAQPTEDIDFEESETSEPIDGNEELVLSVLDPIPVYTIADAEGAPLVATEDEGETVAGVFISQEDANQFVVELQSKNPDLADRVRVIPISLGEIYQLSESAAGEESGLNFAYVPEEESVSSATAIGDANQNPYQGGVPLFVAKGGEDNGYLTIDRNGRQVIPFFFNLEQSEELTTRFAQQQPESVDTLTIEVVPLEGVIETLATSNDPLLEQIVLVPTEESLEFLESADNDREDVYRFFNQETGVHFYTASEVERDNIIENLPNFGLEGTSYETIDPLTGSSDTNVVHRFRNQNTGVHIYTIDEAERSFIAENLSNYEYEGEVFAAYTSQVEGTIPIHRFYNSQLDAHFYTPSEAERESVENNLPNYDYEGIAYYAYPADT